MNPHQFPRGTNETPVSARIPSGRVRDGAFELELSNLATTQHCHVEGSSSLKAGIWSPVGSFAARQTNFEWSVPRGKDINLMFCRVRQEAKRIEVRW